MSTIEIHERPPTTEPLSLHHGDERAESDLVTDDPSEVGGAFFVCATVFVGLLGLIVAFSSPMLSILAAPALVAVLVTGWELATRGLPTVARAVVVTTLTFLGVILFDNDLASPLALVVPPAAALAALAVTRTMFALRATGLLVLSSVLALVLTS